MQMQMQMNAWSGWTGYHNAFSSPLLNGISQNNTNTERAIRNNNIQHIHLICSTILAVDMYKLVCMVRLATFNYNRGELPTLQA